MPVRISVKQDQEGTWFLNEVERRSGQKVYECYQCGKCSGGCPLGSIMDYPPNQIVQMIVDGQKEKLFASRAIYLCLGCATCEANCPSGFAMYRVNETLREMARHEGYGAPDASVVRFNRLFLENMMTTGRVEEIGLMLEYDLKSGKPFQDLPLGIKLFQRGMVRIGDMWRAAGSLGLPGIRRQTSAEGEELRRILMRVRQVEKAS